MLLSHQERLVDFDFGVFSLDLGLVGLELIVVLDFDFDLPVLISDLLALTWDTSALICDLMV